MKSGSRCHCAEMHFAIADTYGLSRSPSHCMSARAEKSQRSLRTMKGNTAAHPVSSLSNLNLRERERESQPKKKLMCSLTPNNKHTVSLFSVRKVANAAVRCAFNLEIMSASDWSGTIRIETAADAALGIRDFCAGPTTSTLCTESAGCRHLSRGQE